MRFAPPTDTTTKLWPDFASMSRDTPEQVLSCRDPQHPCLCCRAFLRCKSMRGRLKVDVPGDKAYKKGSVTMQPLWHQFSCLFHSSAVSVSKCVSISQSQRKKTLLLWPLQTCFLRAARSILQNMTCLDMQTAARKNARWPLH